METIKNISLYNDRKISKKYKYNIFYIINIECPLIPVLCLSAVRTTSPTSPTGTCKPSAHAPCWSSRPTTLATQSGWATPRRPHCGTMTLCAPTGGDLTRPWRGPRRPSTCCQPATGTSCNREVCSSRGRTLSQEIVLRLSFSPLTCSDFIKSL